MWQLIPMCVGLLVMISSNHVSGEVEDYSNSTWPYMVLRVANLDVERKELVYRDKVIPKRKGLIELECIVAASSLPPSLGLEMYDKVAGIEWILPNPKMIEEKRAFIKELGNEKVKLQSLLVLTDFRAEDAGVYKCRLKFKHQYITRYQQQISIPALNGKPILKCELECQRNNDEACQVMGEYHVECQTYSKKETIVQCEFQECDTEAACSVLELNEPDPATDDVDVFNRPTHMYNHESVRATGGLAARSGAFDCMAFSEDEVAVLRLYMPVTVNTVKKPGQVRMPSPTPKPGHPAFDPPKPDQTFGSFHFRKEEWHGTDNIYDFGCWTSKDVGPFEWSFRPIAHREGSLTLTENTLQHVRIKEYAIHGGNASVLHFLNAAEQHGGFYFCHASNDHKNITVHQQFAISSAAWEDDANMNSDATITRQVGSSVTLRCTMRTTEDHIILWTAIDREGRHGTPATRVEYSPDQEIFTIYNLTKEDSGVYSCFDSFDVVTLEGKVTLNVVDHPVHHNEQIESLHHAVKALRAAEEEIVDIVLSMTAHPLGIREEDDKDSSEEKD